MNKVSTTVRKPMVFGNKRPNKWDGRRQRSDFALFSERKAAFDKAVNEARWDIIPQLGCDITNMDVSDFNKCETLFYNGAIPRIRYYIGFALNQADADWQG